jgi:hypothetical protein
MNATHKGESTMETRKAIDVEHLNETITIKGIQYKVLASTIFEKADRFGVVATHTVKRPRGRNRYWVCEYENTRGSARLFSEAI